ncbi:hypothetical protein P170DRAFT_253793 [Aspergillus steynii IBT 23096]|uniref:Uncharacterized protein n=1 Tax=Aspergillus steynii IBT 23096 TaxID=1392250 RepID=A0A2I2FYZ8_9EURO|nr:uncharacterized protein P170DRAFT_253793 [Aspergillus steynii IBT 23096]PLB45860.1 hypothetical protein P170DRAFT_253793 [Aspergillus steynii IBT 23096]
MVCLFFWFSFFFCVCVCYCYCFCLVVWLLVFYCSFYLVILNGSSVERQFLNK